MKNNLSRTIAAVASVIALVLVGTGSAAAVAGPPGGGTGATSTTSAAAKVQHLRDLLQQRADAGDVEGTEVALTELDPLLDEIIAGERYAVAEAAQESAATAKYESAEAAAGLDEIAEQTTQARQLPPASALLNALLQRVLLSLSELVNDLLGGLPPLPAAAG
ncbi:hypothetical protein [Amycolatopsis magusensis]|uniref:hypothetical protein n=1 Tax=Amycolatopsis magusensis TaxID=882444 RepID=UPI0037873C38